MINKVHILLGFFLGLINFGLYMYFIWNKMMGDIWIGGVFGILTIVFFFGIYTFLVK